MDRRIFSIALLGFLATYGVPAAGQDTGGWTKLAAYFQPPTEFAGDFGKYASPLKFADGREVKTAADWPARRAEILKVWHERMGAWPPLLERPQIEVLSTERRENFTQHRIHVDIAPGGNQAEGYLLVPDGTGPFPAVLVTFYEAETSIGLVEKAQGKHDFGYQLAKRGFVTLSIGTPGSIEHKKDTRELLVIAAKERQMQPLSYLGYVSANCHQALTLRREVDPRRIGVVGLSYGGKWAMFSSCLYDKFACAVWSDPGIVFDESNRNVNYYEPWYLGYDPSATRKPGVPDAERPRTGLYKTMYDQGLDLVDFHALMAPRPVLVSGGTEDQPKNWRALNHLIAVYKKLGYTGRVGMTARPTHIPTAEAAEQTYVFFEHFLKKGHALDGPSER